MRKHPNSPSSNPWDDDRAVPEFEHEHPPGAPDLAGEWSDADWDELALYLGADGTPATRAATARRLQTDPAFARLAAPLLALWQAPLPGPNVDVEAALVALKRKAAAAHGHLSAVSNQTGQVPPSSIPLATRTALPSRRWQWPPITVAVQAAVAALLLVFMAGDLAMFLRQRPRELALRYYAAPSAAHSITLADGSTVALAQGSTLVTDGVTANPKGTRLVHLNGTGTFVVHADPRHPFVVEAGGVSAVAVGTTFQVTTLGSLFGGGGKSPSSHISVFVKNGKVVVQRRDSLGHLETLAVLGPGQETSVQTFIREFKLGWDDAHHLSIADEYLTNKALRKADSIRESLTPKK